MIDHAFEPGGKFGRCAHEGCNRGRVAHVALEAHDPPELPSAELPPTPIDWPAPAGLPVYFHLKRHLRERVEDVRLDWPPDWPLPAAGNIIRVRPGEQASVRAVVFDLDRKRIVLDCE